MRYKKMALRGCYECQGLMHTFNSVHTHIGLEVLGLLLLLLFPLYIIQDLMGF